MGEGERKNTNLLLHLTRDQTCNFQVSGLCSNQLSYLARARDSVLIGPKFGLDSEFLKALQVILNHWPRIIRGLHF